MHIRFEKQFRLWTEPLVALLLTMCLTGAAQTIKQPQPVPLPPPIAEPRDQPYPGTIGLLVDITDVQRRVLRVHEHIPVQGKELTLLYPQWIPGNHSPTGPISKVAGLVVTANGNRIQWVRDRVDVYAFHIPIPEGTDAIDVEFDFLAPLRTNQGRISMSSKIADLACVLVTKQA